MDPRRAYPGAVPTAPARLKALVVLAVLLAVLTVGTVGACALAQWLARVLREG